MMSSMKNVSVQTVTFAAIAALSFVMTASAQEHISAPQVFGGDTMFHASTDVNKLLATPMNFDIGVAPNSAVTGPAENGDASLPDAPSAQLRGSYAGVDAAAAQNSHPIVATIHTAYIPAGWTAQPLTAHDKVILGLHDSVSPFSFLGIIFSAGYSHLVNGQPNYGTDKGAFGERLGATAIRDSMEGIFTDSVFAPILHEDPRYYVEGSKYGFIHRVLYAGTRPIITRTDSGHETLNGALLLGYASASAVSYTYYPAINQNFKDTVATFGGGLAGAAIGDLVSEFSDEILVKLHLKHAL